jgi:hypothetical protein
MPTEPGRFLIPIDRGSVKPNPHARQTVFYVPGHPVIDRLDVEGNVISYRIPMQPIHELSPQPDFLYAYVETELVCRHCGHKFPHPQLSEDWDDWYDDETGQGDSCHIENICPKCGCGSCCQVEFEKFDPQVHVANRLLGT